MTNWPRWIGSRERAILDAVLTFIEASNAQEFPDSPGRVVAFRNVVRALGINERWRVGQLADAVFGKGNEMPFNEKKLAATVLPFGTHKGKPFDKTPVSYLDWLVGQGFVEDKFPELFARLESYLDLPHVQRELDALNASDDEARDAWNDD